MKQSTIYWIWLVGSVVWLVNAVIAVYAGRNGQALLSLVVAVLFFAAAMQTRRKRKLLE